MMALHCADSDDDGDGEFAIIVGIDVCPYIRMKLLWTQHSKQNMLMKKTDETFSNEIRTLISNTN